MARPCPRCRSRSIKHDRSLAGRAVCGACGLPLGSPGSGRAGRGALAWLLPLALVVGLLYLVATPEVTPRRYSLKEALMQTMHHCCGI